MALLYSSLSVVPSLNVQVRVLLGSAVTASADAFSCPVRDDASGTGGQDVLKIMRLRIFK